MVEAMDVSPIPPAPVRAIRVRTKDLNLDQLVPSERALGCGEAVPFNVRSEYLQHTSGGHVRFSLNDDTRTINKINARSSTNPGQC